MKRHSKMYFIGSLKIATILFLILSSLPGSAQDVNILIAKVKAKLDKVTDYSAKGKMKTNVPFIKAPVGDVSIFYKSPDHFKLKRSDGISMLPKGGITVNMSNLLSREKYSILDAGETIFQNKKLGVIKLLPVNEKSDVVLTTLYIDKINLLIIRASSTTKDNGTFETIMTYGKYATFGLPDKMLFSFNTKEFKLPKALTMEFDNGDKKPFDSKVKSTKGSVEITYSSYVINKGIPDSEFK